MIWTRSVGVLAAMLVIPCIAPSQVNVKRVQANESALIADGVWAGDTYYVSGQLPDPVTPADAAKGIAAVYGGNTASQALSVFTKIQKILTLQGLDMKDVVKMTVFLTSDPAVGGKMDFAGLQSIYTQFFGTKEQPMKPARSTVQVSAMVAAGALVEIDVIAVRSK